MICHNLWSQNPCLQLISTSGSTHRNNNIEISWSVGELLTESIINGDVTLSQGFHQTSISITEIYYRTDNRLCFNVYPNPTNDFIHLRVDEPEKIHFQYKIYDTNGRYLQTGSLNENGFSVDIKHLAVGVYFLIVYNQQKILSSFKIEKID